MKRINFITSAIITLIFFCPILVHGQGPDPDDVPIDGGLSLLLAAGAAYGVKKYRQSRKKSTYNNSAMDEK